MINARNYCQAITSRASQLGFRLALNTHHNGYSWQWAHGSMVMPIMGRPDPADRVSALCMACEDLAKTMGWSYVESR